ncbi:HD domain-containing protein [bacterium]|nr:MAG: HD domain-containing protein [bacterium]
MEKSHLYKIFSDPVHGFINIPKGIILKLIDHPYVQRLRRIRQLGLGYLVFPGAEHSRFAHALGATGLMQKALVNLKEKNTTITNAEYEATMIAVLLHDIGHGPFSHSLEHSFIKDFHHEKMTLALMHKLNEEFDGALDMAIKIFTNQYAKPFLHQLVSSQLDIDRLDYLKRDSWYTGVSEGFVGVDRIIKTMRVHKGHIVVEKKGIYAIENYILARRLMYMQVYLHKTVLAADKLLMSILKRARYLASNNQLEEFTSPALSYFVKHDVSAFKGISDEIIANYVLMEDNDILMSLKYWQFSNDKILADLSKRFLNRQLFRATFSKKPFTDSEIADLREKTAVALHKRGIQASDDDLNYYLHFDSSNTEAYKYKSESIWIFDGDDKAVEFSKAADTKNVIALTKQVVKPYCVHLKEVLV